MAIPQSFINNFNRLKAKAAIEDASGCKLSEESNFVESVAKLESSN